MAISTDRTVREKLVGAIRGIAQLLGFSEPHGNVREYLAEHHQQNLISAYLMAKVDGFQKARCWAVEVKSREYPHGMENLWKREYSIRIVGYYEVGQNGEGILALIDDARRVRGAIMALTSNLGGTVDLVTQASELDVQITDGSAAEQLLVGEMKYAAERVNPDF